VKSILPGGSGITVSQGLQAQGSVPPCFSHCWFGGHVPSHTPNVPSHVFWNGVQRQESEVKLGSHVSFAFGQRPLHSGAAAFWQVSTGGKQRQAWTPVGSGVHSSPSGQKPPHVG
jgi:hypothetical protein